MISIEAFINSVANNPYFAVVGTSASIVGLILTLWLMWRTKSIDKQLAEIQTKKVYNQTRSIYNNKLRVAYETISDGGFISPSYMKEVLATVRGCERLYKSLLSKKDLFFIYILERELEKEYPKINKNRVANILTRLTSRLELVEEYYGSKQ